MATIMVKRKLIDIPTGVFDRLSVKAGRAGISLKRYIERLLEEDSAKGESVVPEGVSAPGIISLIGVAKNAKAFNWEDERLHYLLSK